MITPAISVLSAIEGVKVAAPSVADLVVPITAAIIVGLFLLQRLGTRRGRAAVRAGHGRLVRRDRRARRPRHRRPPGDPEGAVAHVRARLPVRPLRHGVLLAGGRRARGHRRRGAVRRHGPLRPRPDHPRLAVPGLPGLHPQLPGSGRAGPGDPSTIRSPFFLLAPGLGPAADGVPGRRRDRHRLAGGHHRRVLGDAPGRADRLPAAAAHRAHLGGDDGPDLRAVDQLGAAGRRAHARLHVPAPRPRWPTRTAWRSPARSPSPRCCSSTSSATSGADRCGSSLPGAACPAHRRPAVLRRQPDQARCTEPGFRCRSPSRRSPSSPPGREAGNSSPVSGSATRGRSGRSSTSCTPCSPRCTGCPAPRSSSTAARTPPRWPCAPTSSTTRSCTSTSSSSAIETLPVPHVPAAERIADRRPRLQGRPDRPRHRPLRLHGPAERPRPAAADPPGRHREPSRRRQAVLLPVAHRAAPGATHRA